MARSHNDWLLYGSADRQRLRHRAHSRLCSTAARWSRTAPRRWHHALALYHGGALVNHHPFALPLFLRQLHEERITFTALAPALLSTLLADPALLKDVDLRYLKRNGKPGSAPLNPTLV